MSTNELPALCLDNQLSSRRELSLFQSLFQGLVLIDARIILSKALVRHLQGSSRCQATKAKEETYVLGKLVMSLNPGALTPRASKLACTNSCTCWTEWPGSKSPRIVDPSKSRTWIWQLPPGPSTVLTSPKMTPELTAPTVLPPPRL